MTGDEITTALDVLRRSLDFLEVGWTKDHLVLSKTRNVSPLGDRDYPTGKDGKPILDANGDPSFIDFPVTKYSLTAAVMAAESSRLFLKTHARTFLTMAARERNMEFFCWVEADKKCRLEDVTSLIHRAIELATCAQTESVS